MTMATTNTSDHKTRSSPKKAITREAVLKLFRYDRAEGKLYWKETSKYKQELTGREAGGINCKGYRRLEVDGEEYFAHRLVWLIETGEHPTDQIDHINRVKSDNRISNLRSVSDHQNKHNRGVQPNSTSGETGVSYYRPGRKWRAYINVRGRQISLGYFTDFYAAVSARRDAKASLDAALFGGPDVI